MRGNKSFAKSYASYVHAGYIDSDARRLAKEDCAPRCRSVSQGGVRCRSRSGHDGAHIGTEHEGEEDERSIWWPRRAAHPGEKKEGA
jgi:hypothetical protein